MLRGRRYPFDEESRELYDAVAPRNGESAFTATLEALDARLKGPGELPARFAAFREAFVIPPAKLDAVFTAAIR